MIIPKDYICGGYSASTFVTIMPRIKLFDEDEVLNKAMRLFWKKGYTATSIQDLVSHLGVNRGSLYDTFGGKENLFKKTFELYRNSNIEGLKVFFNNRPNVKEGFLELFNIAIEEAVNDIDCKGCFVINTISELVPNDESLISVLDANKIEIQNLFYEYLKSGKDSGELKTTQNLKSLASFFYTLYGGIRVISKVRPDKKELSDSVNIGMALLY